MGVDVGTGVGDGEGVGVEIRRIILNVFTVFDNPSKHPKIKKEEIEYIISGSGGGPGGSEQTQKSEFGFLKNGNF